jgi:hypothetical protein
MKKKNYKILTKKLNKIKINLHFQYFKDFNGFSKGFF